MAQRELVARFVEGAPDVDLALTLPEVGVRRQTCSLQSFITTAQQWMTRVDGDVPAAAQVRADTMRVLERLRRPDAWTVNGLMTPLRYALFVDGDWRVTVALRSAPEVMVLRYREEDDGSEAEGFTYLVPPRVIAGVWKGATLQSGLVALCEPNALPTSPLDTIHYVAPWVWGNVNEKGQTCWGTTTRPVWGQDGVTTIERGFFDSIFNGDLVRFRIVGDDDDDDEYMTLQSYHERMADMPTDVVTLPVGECNHTILHLLEHSIQHGW